MNGLREFLLARLDEEEQDARTALIEGAWDDLWIPPPVTVQTVMRVNQHIARWNPTRVLAECEAKRRIVVNALRPCQWVLRYLALPYADHPDYRQEWTP